MVHGPWGIMDKGLGIGDKEAPLGGFRPWSIGIMEGEYEGVANRLPGSCGAGTNLWVLWTRKG